MKKRSTLILPILAACASTVPATAGLLPSGERVRHAVHQAQHSISHAIVDAAGGLFWGAAPAAGKDTRQKITDLRDATAGVHLDTVSRILEEKHIAPFPFLAVQHKPLYYAAQESTTSWPIIRQQMDMLPSQLMTPALANWIQQNTDTREAQLIIKLNAFLESWADLRQLGHSRSRFEIRNKLQLFAVESIGRAPISFAAALIEQLRVAPLQRAKAARIAAEQEAARAAFMERATAFVIPAPATESLLSTYDDFPLLPTIVAPPNSPVGGPPPAQGAEALKAFLKLHPLKPRLLPLPLGKRRAPDLVMSAPPAAHMPAEVVSLAGIPLFQSEPASTVFPISSPVDAHSLPVVPHQGPTTAPQNTAYAATQTSPVSPDETPVIGRIISTVTPAEVRVIWDSSYEMSPAFQYGRANSQTALIPRR